MSSTIEMYTNKQGKQFPTIKIIGNGKNADKFPFSMGISKCKLVLAHLEEIKKFVDDSSEYKPRQAISLRG